MSYTHQSLVHPEDPKVAATLSRFIVDLNDIGTTMANSVIRIAALSALRTHQADKRAYKWLAEDPHVPLIMNRLSKYPFLHTSRLINEKRLEEMSYMRQRSVCCISFCIDLMLIS